MKMSTPQFAFNVPVRGIDQETHNKPVCEVTTPQDHQADFGKTLAKLINGNHVVLIEWPSKGLGVLPAANWILEFKLNKSERSLHITSK